MFGDIGKMFKLVSEVKSKLPEMKARLEAAEFTAQAGDGAVQATVKGNMRVSAIEIRNDLLNEGGALILQEHIKSAINAAQEQAAQASAQAMLELTGGAQLPGLEGLLG
jgi:nucleoid-associated protein EbfC